jgi:hypothetical protein
MNNTNKALPASSAIFLGGHFFFSSLRSIAFLGFRSGKRQNNLVAK